MRWLDGPHPWLFILGLGTCMAAVVHADWRVAAVVGFATGWLLFRGARGR